VPPAHSGCEIGVHNTSPPTARKVTATTTLHVGTRAARTVKLNPSKKRKGDEKMGKTVDAGAGHRNRYGPMARRDMHGARVSWFFTAELIEVVDLRVQGGGVRCGMGRSSCRWSPRYRLGYEEGTPPSWRGGGRSLFSTATVAGDRTGAEADRGGFSWAHGNPRFQPALSVAPPTPPRPTP
jgi:hypothetical protein